MSYEILNKYIDENINKPSSLGSIYDQLHFLYDEVIRLNAKIIVELGTDSGSSTIAFLDACRNTGGIVYSFDISECKNAKENISKYFQGNIKNESILWFFEQKDDLESVKSWNKEIDLLFIDTSHKYLHTLNELRLWSEFVKDSGTILLHDTVSRKDEVEKAIYDFLKEKNNIYKYENRENDVYGLGILKKKNI